MSTVVVQTTKQGQEALAKVKRVACVCGLGHLPKVICPICDPKGYAEFMDNLEIRATVKLDESGGVSSCSIALVEKKDPTIREMEV